MRKWGWCNEGGLFEDDVIIGRIIISCCIGTGLVVLCGIIGLLWVVLK